MAWRIGIDEAGLGPNLGPFIVSAVVWEIPDDAGNADLWDVYPEFLTNDPRDPLLRIAIADSKALFQPHRGMLDLERSVLAVLGGWNLGVADLASLHGRLCDLSLLDMAEPWFLQRTHALPFEVPVDELTALTARMKTGAGTTPWRFHAAVSAVISPRDFNHRLERTGNKAEVTSGVHAEVLQRALAQTGTDPVMVFSDKHGGRNRYGSVLSAIFPGEWIDVLEEGALCSRYRVGRAAVRFEPRAECHAVVALASMISKYLRELHMTVFNRYWREQLPDLQPTQGYPVDARRYFARIEPLLSAAGLTKSDVWRNK